MFWIVLLSLLIFQINAFSIKTVENKTSEQRFSSSLNQFSNDVMKQIDSSDKNAVFSPLSIAIGLGMLLDGAKTQTAEEIYSVLKVKNFTDRGSMGNYLNDLLREYKLMHHRREYSRNVTLDLASMALFAKNFTIREEYKQKLRDLFLAVVGEDDFANNAKQVTEKINEYVKNRTHGLIPKLFNKPLDSATIFMLLNTLYFKGYWTNEFNKDFTFKTKFYNSDKTESTVDMMSEKFSSYKHFVCYVHNVTLLEMEYKGSVSMVIILPHEKNGVQRVVQRMAFDDIEHLIGEMKFGRLEVEIPKFSLEFEVDLKNTLPKMGMNSAFSNTADFSGIAPGIKLSKAIHKTVITVDEGGTVAATATSITAIPLSGLRVQRFVCDRPFVFIVRDTQSNVNLFHGVVNKL